MSESSRGTGGSGGQPGTPYDEYSGYTVYDENQDKIGKVDDLFVDEQDRPEYMGVKMGLLGSKTTLVPMEVVHVNDQENSIEVSADKDKIKDGPAFDDDQEIDLDYEARVREHYGLGESPDASERGRYGDYYSNDEDSEGSGVDTEYGERSGDEGSSGATAGAAGAAGAAGGAAAAAGSGDSDDSDSEGLSRRDSDDADSGSRGGGDDEGDTGAVRVRKRVKIERPDAEEEVFEEEVIIEDADEESRRD